MLDKKTFVIGILTLSAIVLTVANFMSPQRASATFNTIKDPDFQMQTATAVSGGDALYITDNRSGKMVIFVWNINTKTLEPLDVQPVQKAFANVVK